MLELLRQVSAAALSVSSATSESVTVLAHATEEIARAHAEQVVFLEHVAVVSERLADHTTHSAGWDRLRHVLLGVTFSSYKHPLAAAR